MIKVESGVVEFDGTGLELTADMSFLIRSYCKFLTKEIGAKASKALFEHVLEAAFSPELPDPFKEENNDEDDD